MELGGGRGRKEKRNLENFRKDKQSKKRREERYRE
jgi:hypothetical protein